MDKRYIEINWLSNLIPWNKVCSVFRTSKTKKALKDVSLILFSFFAGIFLTFQWIYFANRNPETRVTVQHFSSSEWSLWERFTLCKASLPLARQSAEALEGRKKTTPADILTTGLVGFTFEFGTEVDFILLVYLLSFWQGQRYTNQRLTTSRQRSDGVTWRRAS